MADPPLRVLIVDDLRDFADSFGVVLGHLGCETRVAYDVEGALRAAMEQRPQVVFLDLFLGQQSGSRLMQALRRMLGDDEPLTIVCLTGHGSPETELKCRQAGFDLFLVKPVSMALVKDVLATCRAMAATGAPQPPRTGVAALFGRFGRGR